MQARLPDVGAPHILSVTELTDLVRATLDARFGALWVGGEISNVRRPPSGHVYFTLKDDRSQIAAVMFRRAASHLRFDLTAGVDVVARGRVGLYAPRGDLQLYVDAIEPKGLGALQLAFEQLKARLEAEGLFAAERKKPLPFLPRCVGVVTALGGAAIRDILVTLKARSPGVNVRIAPVRVQGAGAGAEIATAIADLDAFGGVDVLIVGRGGGSIEDLWAFNEEVVARAIASSTIPVVSAVGHEIDFTIADFVADARAPTPTAAAQLVVPDRSEQSARVAACMSTLRSSIMHQTAEYRSRVQGLARRLGDPRRSLREGRVGVDHLWWRTTRAVTERMRSARLDLQRDALRLQHLAPNRKLERLYDRLGTARTGLTSALGGLLERQRRRVGQASARLEALSPLAVLERGYALVWRVADGVLIRDAEAISVGDRLKIRFAKGVRWASVDDDTE